MKKPDTTLEDAFMKIIDETVSLFEQDKQYVLNYLHRRNVQNKVLDSIFTNYAFGLLSDAIFKVKSENYAITHFLSKSNIDGYDIVSVNDNLGLSNTSIVAFALVMGDDVLCYDTHDKKVFIWLIQTEDGKKIMIEDSLSDFLNRIIQK